ncbi:unnamed protein product, partial [Effrenium voratum]
MVKRKSGKSSSSSSSSKVVQLDSSSSRGKKGKKKKISRKSSTSSSSSSSSPSSRLRKRVPARALRKRSRSPRRSPRRSPGGRPWGRGGGSEPPLPAYALAYLPQAAVDAFAALSEQPRSETGLRLLGEICHSEWNYVLKDEARRCFAGHLPRPFSSEQAAGLFRDIHAGTAWQRPRDMPRGTAWMVAPGCRCSYRYGGHEVDPQEFPAWMLEVMGLVMPFFGLQAAEWPNSCNLNLYDTGGSSVAWHADDESLFNGKAQDARILSLSLGAPRTFELRPNMQNESKASLRLLLCDGDLCTMEGMVQKHYQHRVPPEVPAEPEDIAWPNRDEEIAICQGLKRGGDQLPKMSQLLASQEARVQALQKFANH